MKTHRSFVAICLAFVLALTGQSMVVARGSAHATGQMVLCTGSGTTVVYVDEIGAPTAAPHICPDCTLSLIAVHGAPVTLAARLSEWQAPQPKTQAIYAQQRAVAYLSRAPPALV